MMKSQQTLPGLAGSFALAASLMACAPQPAPMMVASGPPPVIVELPIASGTAVGNFSQKVRACQNVSPMVQGDMVTVPPTTPDAIAGQARFAANGSGTRAIFTGPAFTSREMLQKAINYTMGSAGCR